MEKWLFFILLVFILACRESIQKSKRPNVLFIAVDDLRPELNCYGSSHIHSPNFDRLASRGVLFERAYCQQAVCAPSRNSLLTGLRPDAIGIYDLYNFFRNSVPNVVTLPEHFKNNGYNTERMGKIYHTGHGNQDDSLSWSQPPWNMGKEIDKLAKIQRGDTIGLERDFPTLHGKKLPFYSSPRPEDHMTDAMIAKRAVERLGQLKDSSFFLAVGFIKPHLPFVVPKKYFDLYDKNIIEVPDTSAPQGMSQLALANFGELRKYDGIPQDGKLDIKTSTELIHGYYASVSMIDAQLGKILHALDSLNLTENTIIVLWGDHGWKLGEYGNWCKHSNIELDTRVPLFFSAPGVAKGVKTRAISEFVDIYPTLCDLAGLPHPGHLQGESLVNILEEPEHLVSNVALSQYPRGPSLQGYNRKGKWMGYSLRTDQHRYTRWQSYLDPAVIHSRELYDHSDNNYLATENLAEDPSSTALVASLDSTLNSLLALYPRLEQ